VYIARTAVILLSLFGFPLLFLPLRGTFRRCVYGYEPKTESFRECFVVSRECFS
jgi:hypothetical protein